MKEQENNKRPKSTAKEHRWRFDLLSSSVQLEYEVARKLSERSYVVRGDYAYERNVAGVFKEYSVDILGRRHVDITGPETAVPAGVELLIECKYRRPDVQWLFLPRVEVPGRRAQESIARLVDEFSSYDARPNGDLSFRRCYKGIEVDISGDGRVDDQQLRHGIEQLQYALIHLFQAILLDTLASQIHEPRFAAPFAVLPVLVTNAPIFVANQEFDSVDLASVTSFAQFSRREPVICLEVGLGPLFRTELRRVFSDKEHSEYWSAADEVFRKLDFRRGRPHKAAWDYESMRSGSAIVIEKWFTTIVICEKASLNDVLQRFDSLVNEGFGHATSVRLD